MKWGIENSSQGTGSCIVLASLVNSPLPHLPPAPLPHLPPAPLPHLPPAPLPLEPL